MGAFEDVAEGRSANLLAAAFEIAADEYPHLSAEGGMSRFTRLVKGFELFRSIHLSEPAKPTAVLAALNDYFFNDLGFRGSLEDYYDPRNSYLNDVVERRVGIPITLSLLYMQLAASAGVELCGVNLPGHFMVAYPARLGPRVYIDVYNGGRALDWQGCCERLGEILQRKIVLKESDFPPMSQREVLVRMLRNLKGIYSQADFIRALRVQERLVRLLPDEPSEQRDLGLLYSRVGKPIQALRTLQALVRRHPALGEVEFIRDSLRHAAREAALAN